MKKLSFIIGSAALAAGYRMSGPMRDQTTIARECGTECANAHSVRRFVSPPFQNLTKPNSSGGK